MKVLSCIWDLPDLSSTSLYFSFFISTCWSFCPTVCERPFALLLMVPLSFSSAVPCSLRILLYSLGLPFVTVFLYFTLGISFLHVAIRIMGAGGGLLCFLSFLPFWSQVAYGMPFSVCSGLHPSCWRSSSNSQGIPACGSSTTCNASEGTVTRKLKRVR